MTEKIHTHGAFTLAEGGRRPLLNLCSRKNALKCNAEQYCHPEYYCHPEFISGSISWQ